jgi:TRADD-N domain-containing protein
MSEPQARPETNTQKLVANLDPTKIQEVAASQVVISDIYYRNVLQHAQRLFRWALIAAGTGLIFFLVAVTLLLFRESVNGALICLASGGVMQAIAMLNFYLYGRAFYQLRGFHERLDRTQQYLLANSICENLKGDVKQATQIELVRGMMRSLARQDEKTEKNTAK